MTETDDEPTASQEKRRLLADLVPVRRKRQGWTQLELAERSGVSLATVQNIESGRSQTPQLSTLMRLMVALDEAPPSPLDAELAARIRERIEDPEILWQTAVIVHDISGKVSDQLRAKLIEMQRAEVEAFVEALDPQRRSTT